jgi:hypothetical protein
MTAFGRRGSALGWLLAFAVPVAAAAEVAGGSNGAPDLGPPAVPHGGPTEASVRAESSTEVGTSASLLIPESLRDIGLASWTDAFQRGRWRGNIGLSFNGQREKSLVDGAGQSFSSRIFDESVTVRNEEFGLIDRRLMSGTIGLTAGVQQFRQTVDNMKSSEHEKLLGYDFDLAFLSETPYRSNIYANRSQSTTALISGGTSETEAENRGIILRLGENSILRDREILPYFRASLEAVQEHDKETTRIADQILRREDRRESVMLSAHNGTETSDLNFRYVASRLKDYINDASSYQDQTVNVNYSLDFGPTLNRRWDSSIDYYTRRGSDSLSLSNVNVSEALTIDHYANLSSSYNYQYNRQESPDGTVASQSAGMQVQHRLYDNLTTSAGVSGSKQTLPTGNADSKGGQLSFSYNHGIPWQGHMVGGIGGSYFINASHVPGGTVPVVDAPYTAPPSLGAGAGFALKDSFIDVSTISIVDIKGGARIPTAAGVDYLVVVDGLKTTIQPLPTSVVIMPNDLLQVSYIYEVPPDLKYRITTRSANLGLYWRWISLDFSHDESDSTPLSGGDSSLLVSNRQDSARLSLNGAWDNLQARGDARVLRYDGNIIAYKSATLDEFVDYAVTPELSLALSANQYRTDYTLPVRKVTGRSIRLDANLAWEGWLANAYALQRNYTDTEIQPEKYQEAGFKLHRRWLKLELTTAVYANRRWRGGTETQNATVQITVVRQF